MKHFVIEVSYQVPYEQVAESVAEHRAYLQIGYERGWFLCNGPQEPRVGGILIARAPSLEELQDFFKQDPYALKRLATYRFVEFVPVKTHPILAEWIKG